MTEIHDPEALRAQRAGTRWACSACGSSNSGILRACTQCNFQRTPPNSLAAPTPADDVQVAAHAMLELLRGSDDSSDVAILVAMTSGRIRHAGGVYFHSANGESAVAALRPDRGDRFPAIQRMRKRATEHGLVYTPLGKMQLTELGTAVFALIGAEP